MKLKSIYKYSFIIIGLIALLYTVLRVTAEITVSKPDAVGEFFVHEGKNVHYRCIGEGPNIVIFETGFGSDSLNTWGAISEQVSDRAKSCWYDRLGYGWSDDFGVSFSLQQKAQVLSELIELVSEGKPVILVAHSYGGVIARRAISDYSIPIKTLILVDSAHENQHAMLGELLPPIPQSVARATYLDALFGLSKIKNMFNREGSDEHDRVRNYFASKKYSNVLNNYVELGGFFTPLKNSNIDLNDVELVVLEHDPQTYPATERWEQANRIWHKLQSELAALSTNSIFATVPKASHNIPQDNPEYLVNQILIAVE
ncbi:alpha/beta hydrolase [Alteromonas sp. 1_MG-2023]|uniref:alpha/beta fold hydrolase n=1 Tax=Alteromonas sp. 1_MG-2023 TaxID=3062669 RepID=UPI0026E20F6D|nr:alpha/beta hydrolase [Alteromonas sp. 1_MG-2023]MDO6567212.1 alpha/beta hydrolase [Alteromonas sp. 1_MG-2023]